MLGTTCTPATLEDKKRVHFTLITHFYSSWLKTEVSRQKYQDKKTPVSMHRSFLQSSLICFDLFLRESRFFASYHFNLSFIFAYIQYRFRSLKSYTAISYQSRKIKQIYGTVLFRFLHLPTFIFRYLFLFVMPLAIWPF